MQLVIPLLPRNRTLPRSGAPLRRLVVVWTSLALLALVLVATARAANPPIVQKYYLPYPEHDLLITLTNLWGNRSTVASSIQYFPTNPMTTYATITVPLAGTVVYYDHWEDGYESDLAKPQQSTTQVWGDGDPTNGSAPGVPGDVIPAGRVIVLFNQLDSRTLQAVIDYDARDKIGASKGVAVVRSGWASQSNTLMAGAVEVFHTGIWGTDYRAPIGESPSIPQTDHYDQFDYVAFFISAGEGGATVNIDKDNNGVFETTVTLAEGESHRVHGGVQLGGRVTSDRPVQVILFAADWGGFFETRDSSLLPTTSWGSDYYAPVSTPASVTWLSQGNPTTFTPPSVVWLYNPNAGSITVNREWRVGSGSLSTASSAIAGGGYLKVNLVDTAAYRFYTTGSPAPVF